MRTIITTALLLSLTATYVAASDPIDPIVRTEETGAIYDWSGPYIGANIGYGWGKSKFTDAEYNGGHAVFPVIHWDVKSSGLNYGLQAGYNIQRDTLVYGVEGAFGYHHFNGSRLQPGVDVYGDPYDATGTVDGGLYGSVNFRLGYAHNSTLIFVKAGAIYSNAKVGFYDNCITAPCGPGVIDAVDKLGFGYQLGAGVEQAIDANWSVKLDYTFSDFGKAKPNATVVGGSFNQLNKGVSADLVDHAVRVGLNYKF